MEPDAKVNACVAAAATGAWVSRDALAERDAARAEALIVMQRRARSRKRRERSRFRKRCRIAMTRQLKTKDEMIDDGSGVVVKWRPRYGRA